MIFKNVIKRINEAFMISGYSRAANELLMLSERQLADIGISRKLLKQGYSAYPWREEAVNKAIPDNVSQIKAETSPANQTTVMPKTPKAA